MQLTGLQKFALGAGGVTAFAIGAFIALAPQAFYSSYGIAIGSDPSLLSEYRAPGTGLAVLGILMLAGIVRATSIAIARAAAFTVFLAFPLGRVIGIVMDGMPSANILGALAIEAVIAGLLLFAFRPGRSEAVRGEDLVGLRG